ncbi:MAG: hypothetical protein H5T80_10765, partial [Dietzia sp.]|nr:hypothetical protein [Dietzia sp.]
MQAELRELSGNQVIEVVGFGRAGLNPPMVQQWARGMTDMFRRFPGIDLQRIGLAEIPFPDGRFADVVFDTDPRTGEVRRGLLFDPERFLAAAADDDPNHFLMYVSAMVADGRYPDVVLREPVNLSVAYEFGRAIDYPHQRAADIAVNSQLRAHYERLGRRRQGLSYEDWLDTVLPGHRRGPQGIFPAEVMAAALAEVAARRLEPDQLLVSLYRELRGQHRGEVESPWEHWPDQRVIRDPRLDWEPGTDYADADWLGAPTDEWSEQAQGQSAQPGGPLSATTVDAVGRQLQDRLRALGRDTEIRGFLPHLAPSYRRVGDPYSTLTANVDTAREIARSIVDAVEQYPAIPRIGAITVRQKLGNGKISILLGTDPQTGLDFIESIDISTEFLASTARMIAETGQALAGAGEKYPSMALRPVREIVLDQFAQALLVKGENMAVRLAAPALRKLYEKTVPEPTDAGFARWTRQQLNGHSFAPDQGSIDGYRNGEFYPQGALREAFAAVSILGPEATPEAVRLLHTLVIRAADRQGIRPGTPWERWARSDDRRQFGAPLRNEKLLALRRLAHSDDVRAPKQVPDELTARSTAELLGAPTDDLWASLPAPSDVERELRTRLHLPITGFGDDSVDVEVARELARALDDACARFRPDRLEHCAIGVVPGGEITRTEVRSNPLTGAVQGVSITINA